MISKRLIGEIQATAELCGYPLSDGALLVLSGDLESYDDMQIIGALRRCRMEVKGRLTPAEILSRIDDGHIGPEEAWAMLPRDEACTVVMTGEMAEAWGIARPLIDAGDEIAGRMAFREVYVSLISQARAERRPPKWFSSLGHDIHGREQALREAVEKGRLTYGHAAKLLPDYSPSPVKTLPNAARRSLPVPERVQKTEQIAGRLAVIMAKLKGPA